MAAKGKEAEYEEDSSDIEATLYDDDDDDEEEEGENEELLHLHKRISQTLYPLSEEALGVLHEALLSLNSQPMPLPPNPLLSPLLLQLKSLSTRIPPSQGDEASSSCVITGALNYLEKLRRVSQSLKEGMQESTSLRGGSSKGELKSPIEGHSFCNGYYAGLVKVKRISNAKLHILVHCKKRKGLMSSLILALDTLGLVIDQMDITGNDVFMVDAITIQVGEMTIDDESVKEALWKMIHEGL